MSDDEEGVGSQRLVQWVDSKRRVHDVPPGIKRSLEEKYRGQKFGDDASRVLNFYHDDAIFVEKRTITRSPANDVQVSFDRHCVRGACGRAGKGVTGSREVGRAGKRGGHDTY
jgi:ketosteroid isomerase-like protein